MRTPDSWGELMFNLQCLSKGSAKKRFRNFIRYSFGGLCAYCRKQRAVTVDHLKPRSKGGSNLRSNLVPCCVECNQSKSSQEWVSWFESQTFYNEVAKELILEWVNDTRLDYDYFENDEHTIDRTEVCTQESALRSNEDEPVCFGAHSLKTA
jgi:hypothetical protein